MPREYEVSSSRMEIQVLFDPKGTSDAFVICVNTKYSHLSRDQYVCRVCACGGDVWFGSGVWQ